MEFHGYLLPPQPRIKPHFFEVRNQEGNQEGNQGSNQANNQGAHFVRLD